MKTRIRKRHDGRAYAWGVTAWYYIGSFGDWMPLTTLHPTFESARRAAIAHEDHVAAFKETPC